jgi:hypothetical protein
MNKQIIFNYFFSSIHEQQEEMIEYDNYCKFFVILCFLGRQQKIYLLKNFYTEVQNLPARAFGTF